MRLSWILGRVCAWGSVNSGLVSPSVDPLLYKLTCARVIRAFLNMLHPKWSLQPMWEVAEREPLPLSSTHLNSASARNHWGRLRIAIVLCLLGNIAPFWPRDQGRRSPVFSATFICSGVSVMLGWKLAGIISWFRCHTLSLLLLSFKEIFLSKCVFICCMILEPLLQILSGYFLKYFSLGACLQNISCCQQGV